MGLLDSVLGSGVPGGNISKALMIGLAALLAAHVTRSGGLGSLMGGGGMSAPTPPVAPPATPVAAQASRRAVFRAVSAACCNAFSKADTATLSIRGSDLDRTNRSRRISFIRRSAPMRSTTCRA